MRRDCANERKQDRMKKSEKHEMERKKGVEGGEEGSRTKDGKEDANIPFFTATNRILRIVSRNIHGAKLESN